MLLLPSGSRLNDNSNPPNAAIPMARPSFYLPYCVFRALHGASALQRLVVALIRDFFALKRLCKLLITPQVFFGFFFNLGAILANSVPGNTRKLFSIFRYTYYVYICSLVALVFKGSALLVFPVIQPHTYSVLIDARMCGSVNEVNTPIPCVGEPQQCLQFTQTLGYKLVNTWFLQLYQIFPSAVHSTSLGIHPWVVE